MIRAAVLAATLLLAFTARLRAQSAAELLARGVTASQNLDYDSAAAYLRAALARSGADALPDTARPRALMFLGATELFRDRRDSATAAFSRLILLNPRYRADQLLWPPEVSSLFEQVRSGSRAVMAVLPPETRLAGPGDRLAVRLYASAIHEIRASVARAGAAGPGRTLYAGAIGDSLEILWDGRDSAQAPPADSAAFVLRVASLGAAARPVRLLEVPLEVRQLRPDTLPWPAPMSDSLFRPETTGGAGGTRALAGGFLAAAAVIVMPQLVAGRSDASGGRYAVAAASGAAGLIGFRAGRRPQPIPANIASNQALRAAWQRRLDTVKSENAERLRGARLTIRAGAPRQVTPP